MDRIPVTSTLAWAAGLGLAWALFGPSKRQAQKPKSNSFNAWIGDEVPQAAPPPHARQTTSFGAWTRGKVEVGGDAPAPKNSAVFGTWIKKKAPPTAGPAAAKKEEETEPVNMDAVRVPIFFGTEFGFSKEIAGTLAKKLKETGEFWPVVMDMAEYDDGYQHFSEEQVVFMICSTQGDGVPPAEARGFCEWLWGPSAPSLNHASFSVCALGDNGYEKFCACGKNLDTALEKAGATRCAERKDINREDYKAVGEWMDDVMSALPKLGLKSMAAKGWAGPAVSNAAPKPKKWGKTRPYVSTVAAVEGLCNITHKDDKDTVRAQFDLGDSGITYMPGDALGVYASNSEKYVDELIAVLGASASAPVPVPAFHYEDADAPAGSSIALRDALLKCYDIKTPKPELFKVLEAAGAKRKVKAAGVTLGKLLDMAPETEKYLEDSHIVDIVRDFAPAGKTLPIADVLSGMRALQPRLYSISSSPLEGAGVQATCAVVRYNARDAERVGVCSTFMAERAPTGKGVPVYIAPNPDFRLPEDASTPIVMVGPGTGLSPFRSFIQHRLAEGQPKSGPNVLYFGCRRRDQDYLYGDMLEGLAQEGKITLHTAFSREGKDKVYVQDRLLETAEALWGLLEAGAHFYICGDAKYMAPSVERAVLSIIAKHQGKGANAAKEYLAAMSSSGRFQKDVWA